jgi:hypothetical protein
VRVQLRIAIATLVLSACATSSESSVESDLVTGPTNLSQSTAPSTLAFNMGNNLAVDGRGNVTAVWTEGGPTSGAIGLARSLDDGQHWSPMGTFAPSPIHNPYATLGPRVAASGDDIYIAWHGEYALPGLPTIPRIYLIRSNDAGANFVGPTLITPTAIAAAMPSIAADGANVVVVWTDDHTGHAEIYARLSTDHGASFGPTVSVSVPDNHSSWTPAVALHGSQIHVAWSDERNDTQGDCADRHDNVNCFEEEYYRRSLDGGANWGPEVRLTTDVGTSKSSWAPTIAVANGIVHVAYFDFRTGIARVYYQRSIDNGLSWPPSGEQLLSPATDTLANVRPVLAAVGNDVRMVFWRQDQWSATPADVDLMASSGAGAAGSWQGPFPLTQNIGATVFRAEQPQVALSPVTGTTHVMWMDNTTGNTEIEYVRVR